MLINGARVGASSGATRRISNPATLALMGTVPEGGLEDVGRAVAAARSAQPKWQGVPVHERIGLLRAIGAQIRAHAERLANLMTMETGSPWCESMDRIAAVADCWTAADPLASRGDQLPHVVAAIANGNLPLLPMAATMAQVIAAGDTVICKPAQCVLGSLLLADLYEMLPPGVVNVITGGAEADRALAEHPEVAVTAVGATSWRPIIVLDDADLEIAVPGVAWERLRHSGQTASSKCVYVARSLAAEFADRIHETMAFLEVGDPQRRDTDLGPLITREAARRVEGADRPRREGRGAFEAGGPVLPTLGTSRPLLSTDGFDRCSAGQCGGTCGDFRARGAHHSNQRRRGSHPRLCTGAARRRFRVHPRSHGRKADPAIGGRWRRMDRRLIERDGCKRPGRPAAGVRSIPTHRNKQAVVVSVP